MCTVVNKKTSACFDVYIGRGSRWGNPFHMRNESQREAVISQYRQHLWRQIREGEITVSDLLALEGKTLACFCAPKACHGDVIANAVAWALKQENQQVS